jgi:hypothetical protein
VEMVPVMNTPVTFGDWQYAIKLHEAMACG